MSGFGKRFIAAGYTDPKPLITVDDLPIIKHVMNLFPGETDIHCICNREHIETTNMRSILEGYGATVHVIEPHTLGPVHATLQIKDILGDEEEILLSYCDYGTVWNYGEFLQSIVGMDGAIPAYRGFHPHMLGTDNYAFLRMDSSGLVAEVREKEPFTQNRMEEYASNGTYYFRRGADVKHYFQRLIDLGIQKNGEYYISLAYNLLIQDKKRISVFEIEKMLQWGTPKDLEEYRVWSDHFKQAIVPQPLCQSSASLILPLAGRGSRFLMNGFTVPKPLLDINGKPMIIRAVESIPHCKSQTFICLNEHMSEYPLKNTLEQDFSGCTVIGIDEVTEGQACTCEIGLKGTNIKPDDPIMISACDNGIDYDRNAYMRLENDTSVDVIVFSFTNNPTGQLYPHMYAWLDVDASNNIRHVSVKKPLPGATHAIIGTMFFRSSSLYLRGLKDIYEKNIRTNGEFYVDNLLNPLIEAGYTVKVFPVDAYICWGTPNDYKTYIYWYEHFSKIWGPPLIM